MKRIGAFSLAFFIFVLSVFSVIPVDVYADDNKTVLPFTFKQLNNSVGAGMSASDANAAVTAHKDIYTSDGTLLFIYNPSNSYNWTTSSKAYYLTLNYSDEQLKNILMSKNPLSTLFNVWGAALSNNNGIRAFCAGLGTIFSGNSDMGTKVLDTLSGNYNYLDALSYDEDSQTITMSNDNGSVDKLREEIKKYYYDLIGLNEWKASGTVKEWVDSPTFRKSFDYEEDYNNGYGYSQYNYVICSGQYFSYFFNEADLFYISNGERINLTVDNWDVLFYKVYFYNKGSSSSSFIPADKAGLITHYQYTYHDVTECALYRSNSYGFAIYPSPATWSSETSKESSRNILLYSKDKKPLKYFSSYGALYTI